MAVTLNENERSLVEELATIIKSDEGTSIQETTLARFLRARDHNIKKAEQMLKKSLEWRNTHDIDSICKWEVPSAIVKDFKMYYTGVDKESRPVYVIPIGRWDGRKILSQGFKEDTCKYMYKTLEVIMRKCEGLGVSKFHVILDFTDLSFWKVAHWDSIENVIRVIREFESNYPETLYSAHCINAPSVFWQAFKAVKPILAQNTMEKIHIFDSDKKKWQDHLLSTIPKESLPSEYGGTGKSVEFFPVYADQI